MKKGLKIYKQIFREKDRNMLHTDTLHKVCALDNFDFYAIFIIIISLKPVEIFGNYISDIKKYF